MTDQASSSDGLPSDFRAWVQEPDLPLHIQAANIALSAEFGGIEYGTGTSHPEIVSVVVKARKARVQPLLEWRCEQDKGCLLFAVWAGGPLGTLVERPEGRRVRMGQRRSHQPQEYRFPRTVTRLAYFQGEVPLLVCRHHDLAVPRRRELIEADLAAGRRKRSVHPDLSEFIAVESGRLESTGEASWSPGHTDGVQRDG